MELTASSCYQRQLMVCGHNNEGRNARRRGSFGFSFAEINRRVVEAVRKEISGVSACGLSRNGTETASFTRKRSFVSRQATDPSRRRRSSSSTFFSSHTDRRRTGTGEEQRRRATGVWPWPTLLLRLQPSLEVAATARHKQQCQEE